MGLDRLSGNEVAAAIDARIQKVAQEVYTNSPANRTVYGRVVSHFEGIFSVEVMQHTYTNITALRNVGNIANNETVICLVPNNQYASMVIIGVADGTLNPSGGDGDITSVEVQITEVD